MNQLPHLNRIRKIYNEITADLIKHYPKTDPNFYDWDLVFTPIEKNVWYEIRTYGLPMYPQFPVGKYTLDFADIVKKIGIEAEGKAWHDAAKDDIRDKELAGMGWTIYRIKGKDTFLKNHRDEDEPDALEWHLNHIIQEHYQDLIR